VPISWKRSNGLAVAAVAAGLILLGMFGLGIVGLSRALDRDRLWKIVHDECVPNETENARPAPCALVALQGGVDRGYAMYKDMVGVAQYLLIPTARVSGIESPELLAPGAPNYFAMAWRERSFTERALGRPLPRAAIGLAVNPANWRGQDQFHIHIDCLRPDVTAALQRHIAAVGDSWAPFPEPLAGHTYRALKIVGEEFDAVSPVKLVADGIPGAAAAMGAQTLVVVGADFADDKPGFVILNAQADPGAGLLIKGEELQDHSCAVAPD
jgi:CDP-diacylglycerol pyrophosphatase